MIRARAQLTARALSFALVFVFLASAGRADDAVGFKSGVFDPPRSAPDFTLRGSHGAALTLSQYRGKVVLLAFGFSYCRRVCPVTLASLARVSSELGAAASDVKVLFVTVDPERDTPERLKEFLALFHPAYLGATGTSAQLDAVRKAYGVTAGRERSPDQRLGYEVHHSSSIFGIDRAGKLRLLVPFGKAPADILHDVKLLLAK
jgi:protein SCO1